MQWIVPLLCPYTCDQHTHLQIPSNWRSPYLRPSVGFANRIFWYLTKYSLLYLNGNTYTNHPLAHTMVLMDLVHCPCTLSTVLTAHDMVSSWVLPPPPPSVATTPVKTSATPVDNNTSSKYPHLSRALGDEDGYLYPDDSSVKASLQGLLQETNNLLSTNYELNVRAISSNKPIFYIWVSRIQSENAFTNSKEWLNTTIKISWSQHGGTFESAKQITYHLIKLYNDSFLAACQTQGIPVIKPISATEL